MVRAQDTGWITGSVADPSGAAVPKATVNLILHGGSRPVATTVTTAQGLFTLQTLRPVYYDLTVDAAGFQQYKLDNVKVDPSRPTDIPKIVLKLAATAASVNVTAGLETVQTTSPELSTTVTAEQIERLPVGDRNPLEFISTQSGVSPGNANGYETDINGQRSSFSNVTLDGINIQDNYIRTGDLDYTPNQPMLSQVQEFTVITSNQGAASSGGASQVNFTTPSGTNQYHGSVFWQNRNNDFAANDFFDNSDGNPLPRLNLNQLGANVGGPIKKDKLFFYGTYETYRLKGQQEEDATILTSTARQGIFKYVPGGGGPVQQANVLSIVDLSMDPLTSSLLAQVPDATHINNYRVGDSEPGLLLNTAGYGFLVRANTSLDNVLGKMDYYVNPTNSITATYAWNRLYTDRPDVTTSYSTVPPFYNDNSRNFLALAWRTNPRPTWTNEVRAGMNLAPATFSYSGTLPAYVIGGLDYTSPDPVENAQTLPQGRNTRTYSMQDNATWTHGRHTLKFGAFYQGVYVRTYDYTGTVPDYNVGIGSENQAGNLLFSTDLPGASALDLNNANLLLASLAGLLDNDNQTFNVTSRTSGFVPGAPYLRHFTYDNLAFYGQDEWKVLPRLTLTGSLRWEYYSPVNERDSLELQPLVTGTPQQTLLSDGTLYFTGNSVDRPFYHKDLNNFAPSIGLAWDPFGKGKTSVRAGYGISYVTDEAIQVAEAFTGTNPGLASLQQNVNLSGFVSTDRTPFATPNFQVPLTFDQGYAQNPEVYYGLLNPNLRTPYVQEWNFTIQHEIKGTIIQAGYVANHGTKLLRGFDYNQEQIPANFLSDFLKAQQNGFLAEKYLPAGGFNPAYNRSIPGSQPLPTFNGIPNGGYLSDGTVQSDIQTGQVADLGALYQINGLVGSNSGPNGGDTSLNFFPNPNALGSTYLTNFSNSTFNSLQLEARHRFANGLEFQGNFTWEKWLSDTAGIYQNRFEPFMDINNTAIERARTPTDLTYQFKGNYAYDLPFGEGHRFGSGRILNRIIGGWMTSGNITWTSGPPFSVYSGLGTFLSAPDSYDNEATTLQTMSQLDSQIKFRMTGNGPYMVPTSAIGSDGRGVAPPGQAPFSGQLFYNPGPDQLGSLQKRIFDGPPIFNMDAKLAKSIKINERISSQLYMEALNVFNHPNWFVGDQNINSQQFGKITSISGYVPRELELGLKVSF